MAQHSFASAKNHHSLDGSFRKSHTAISGSSSSSSSSSTSSRRSRRHLRELDCASRFVESVEEWVSDKMRAFACPFTAEELRELDVATEAVLFQQLFRMPLSPGLSQDHYVALHHFLHAVFAALWPAFWRKSRPPPFLLSCPRRRPRSEFYTLPDAVAKGAVHELVGFALMSAPAAAGWDRALLFVLLKQDILSRDGLGISAPVVCEALFYGFHMLASRRLRSGSAADAGRVFVLVVDSRYGGVVTLGGDLAKLERSSADPLRSAVEWVKSHADVAVSPADLVWNKLGNPNWRDAGALRLVLATFHSMAQWSGPPRRSVASLASGHDLRLEKRWMECWQVECDRDGSESALGWEIAEVDGNESSSSGLRLRLKEGEMVVVDDRQKSAFRVQECGIGGNKNAYSARAACGDGDGDELVALYVGAHPSRLEPCWEDMSVWYQVQRQTKVLNILSQRACQHLPRVVAWGRVLHPGPCRKQGGGRCDHPWCGTPILATSPVGEALSSVVEREGWLTGEEAVRCCRDCLGALSSAAAAGVQHGDMCPESIIRVSEASGSRYVVTGWGRAVVEGRDGGGGGAAINLRFSSGHALQHGKVCPSSDVESLLYVLLYSCGGSVEQQETIESALQWRDAMWAQRSLQNRLGQLSPILKAFADYVDTLCGTPYPVDFNFWLSRFSTMPDSLPC